MARLPIGIIFAVVMAISPMLALRRKTIRTPSRSYSRATEPFAYWTIVTIGFLGALFILAWSFEWFGLGALTPGRELN